MSRCDNGVHAKLAENRDDSNSGKALAGAPQHDSHVQGMTAETMDSSGRSRTKARRARMKIRQRDERLLHRGCHTLRAALRKKVLNLPLHLCFQHSSAERRIAAASGKFRNHLTLR